MNRTKSFDIPKMYVWLAYKRVKANQGASGVDGVSIQDLEMKLKDNLYKLWNRMSSGSYRPPPVRLVDIPKAGGMKRQLGIPTVLDRIAQTVVKGLLEVKTEPHFHPDSYGYRPKTSALKAIAVARRRCWQNDWVLDIDIQGFFDSLDHKLLMKEVKKYTDSKWMLMYIERWLKAPIQMHNGILKERSQGTPQGGVISPLLANIFLHHVFDLWMKQEYPEVKFERYADDIVVHCKSQEQAVRMQEAIEIRFKEYHLKLHPTKTKIVYCKNSNRHKDYPEVKFDFLGYTFRPRKTKNRNGKCFIGFNPAISASKAKTIRQTIRKWRLHQRTSYSLNETAVKINPYIQGWINYYGAFYRSELYSVFNGMDKILHRWALRKYKRMHRRWPKAEHWLRGIKKRNRGLFAHWNIRASQQSGWLVGAV